MKYCNKCGNELSIEDTTNLKCSKCGSKLEERKSPNGLIPVLLTILVIIIPVVFYCFIWPAIRVNIRKPMIYIYPTEEMDITIKLGNKELLTTTYPVYNDGWNVHAQPDGTLTMNGKEYYGLYWEGIRNNKANYNDGFIVPKEDTISFLEEKLSLLGLNDREANEFIVYWLPILEESNYNLIRFQDIETINAEMPLIITPKPDTLIRIIMEYKPLNKPIKIKEQKLTKVERFGYTVVEWGGTKLRGRIYE